MNSLEQQVGGDHYRKHGALQPWCILREYLPPEALRGYHKGTAIVYLLRERDKGGDEDIRKALHTLQHLVETAERKVHNPDNLSDPGEGYRFAYVDEKLSGCSHYWSRALDCWRELHYPDSEPLRKDVTYRVKLIEPPAERQVHNPDKLTDPGEGYRFAYVGEKRSACSHYWNGGAWEELEGPDDLLLSKCFTYRVKL